MVRRTALWISIMGIALLLPMCFGGEEKAGSEQYSGVVMATGGAAGGSTLSFDFRIDAFTSDEDVKKYVALLKDSGQDALQSALDKLDVGQIYTTGSLGNRLAIARKRQKGTDTIITLVTARAMSFLERYSGGRINNYPFGFMQVTLNEKGEGTAQIMAAARLKFNEKDKIYEIESYGNQYVKAVNIRRRK